MIDIVDCLKNAGLSCILLAVEKKLRRKENNDRPAEPILPQSGLFRQWEARAGEHQEVQQEGEALFTGVHKITSVGQCSRGGTNNAANRGSRIHRTVQRSYKGILP